MVAAVDLARVRLPLAEEEEAAEGDTIPQAREIRTETRVVETKVLGPGAPPAVSVTSDELRVQVSQVRTLLDSCCGHTVPSPPLNPRCPPPDPENNRSVLPRGHRSSFAPSLYRF